MTTEVNKHGVPIHPPLMPEVGVVSTVPEVWGNPWQSRHHVLTRLAKYFHVVWFNPVREWRQVLGQKVPGMSAKFVGGRLGPGFCIYNAGPLLPRLHKPAGLAKYVMRRRYENAQRILQDQGCRSVILYNWRPEFTHAHDHLKHDVSCYHIDDEYSFSKEETAIDNREMALIKRVDQVMIHSPALMEKKGNINPHTASVPNGVEFCKFSTPHDEPEDMRNIPRPRIGYVGYIKRQLDFELQLQLVKKHRDWSFVYVGPKGILNETAKQVDELFSQPNVHYLRFKPKDLLPAYAQHMDVLFMSYQLDAYTKYIYPLKIHEFFATGRPVVATPIRSLQQFEGDVYLANTIEEWSESITKALSDGANSTERVAKRQAIAHEHDWDTLVDKITGILCDRLGDPHPERFREIRETVTDKRQAV